MTQGERRAEKFRSCHWLNVINTWISYFLWVVSLFQKKKIASNIWPNKFWSRKNLKSDLSIAQLSILLPSGRLDAQLKSTMRTITGRINSTSAHWPPTLRYVYSTASQPHGIHCVTVGEVIRPYYVLSRVAKEQHTPEFFLNVPRNRGYHKIN